MRTLFKVMFTAFLLLVLVNFAGALQELDCTELNFSIPEDVDLDDPSNIPILKVQADLLMENWFSESYLNDELIKRNGFKCKENECEQYFYLLDFEDFLEQNNTLKICTYNHLASIHNDYELGFYEAAYFPKEKFIKEVEKTELLIGDELEITITLENVGSKNIEVEIKHKKPVVEEYIEITSFNVLKGDSDWKGVVEAGRTKTLTYTIKPTIAAHFTLPAAFATFENEFGGTIELVSNYPEITVRSPEKKVSAYIFRESEFKKVGERARIRAIIKNNGTDTIPDVKLVLNFPSELGLVGEKEIFIGALRGNEVVYFDYEIVSTQEGEFNIGCSIKSGDESFKCEGATIKFEEEKVDLVVVGAFLLLIVAVVIYAYIFFERRPKKE